jgi:hypothetical protein
MDRLQQGQSGTLNAYWERNGVAWDPGTVQVSVSSQATGTVIASGLATGTGNSGRTFVLAPSNTAGLDYLTITWTSLSDSSVLTTYAEIVGDFHFTVAFARTRTPLGDTATYSTQQVLDYRTLAEMAIEDICGVSFVPRYRYDIARIVSWGMLELPRRRIRSVLNIYTQADSPSPVAIPSLAGLRIENGGLIFMPAMFNWWSTPIYVSYVSGYDFVPPRVARASLELCRRWLVESPWDERTTGFRTRDGGQMTILTANHTDAFDIPEVVAVADAYGTPAVM